MRADNLYSHPDGGFYCLLSEDAPMKCPETGEWLPGVIYLGADGKMRSTTELRWSGRFVLVADYHGDDEAVLAMIRRANPEPFDLGDVMTAWHESEVQVSSELLRLMAATVALAGRFKDPNLPELVLEWDSPVSDGVISEVGLTIEPSHLAYVSTHYAIEWEPDGWGYRIKVRK